MWWLIFRNLAVNSSCPGDLFWSRLLISMIISLVLMFSRNIDWGVGWLRYFLKLSVPVSLILLARFSPTLQKYLLNSLVIIFWSVIWLSFINSFSIGFCLDFDLPKMFPNLFQSCLLLSLFFFYKRCIIICFCYT